VGPGYHAVGDDRVMTALPGFGATARFLWMDTTAPTVGDERGAWLAGADGVAEFLAVAAPRSFAVPGGTGVRRSSRRSAAGATCCGCWRGPSPIDRAL
jgi:hypothetical protein